MKAVLLLAHGAPENLDDVENYVLRIRHGRPLAPEAMSVIRDRYRQVGGSPLLKWTQAQASALDQRLKQSQSDFSRVYIGMRHSRPYILDTIREMKADGIQSFRAICMAPQFSMLSIGAYSKELEEALVNFPLEFTMTRSYAKHPQLIHAFSTMLAEQLENHQEAMVIFTAHSLPERILAEGDPYDFEAKETARLVARNSGLADWRFAYQSQGMTADKWLGPTVESRIDEAATKGLKTVIIVPIGFVCDHVEILYDIDIFYKDYARTKSMDLRRTRSLNDSPEFIALLQQLLHS